MSKYTNYFKEVSLNNMSQKTLIKDLAVLSVGDNKSVTFTYKNHRVSGSMGDGTWYFISDNEAWNKTITTASIKMGDIQSKYLEDKMGTAYLKCPKPLTHLFTNLEPNERGFKDVFNMIFVALCAETCNAYKKENVIYNEDGRSAEYHIEEHDDVTPESFVLKIQGINLVLIFKFDDTDKPSLDIFRTYDMIGQKYADWCDFI